MYIEYSVYTIITKFEVVALSKLLNVVNYLELVLNESKQV